MTKEDIIKELDKRIEEHNTKRLEAKRNWKFSEKEWHEIYGQALDDFRYWIDKEDK